MYALICTDKPDALDIRKSNRDAHLTYIEDSGVVAQAGPFLDDEGMMCGSLVILNVDTHDAAKAWGENDPYAKAGLFQDVRIEAWKKVIG